MNLKKIGEVFTSKFVGTGPYSYKKRIYRATVSQSLRNTGVAGDLAKARSGSPSERYRLTKLLVSHRRGKVVTDFQVRHPRCVLSF